jgi:hypothetical protein
LNELWLAVGSDNCTPHVTLSYGRLGARPSEFNRAVEATDPLGAKERVEYRAQRVPADVSVPAPTVAGINDPIYLQYRNTLYWDKGAMAVAPGDPAAAHLYHWLHLKGNVNAVTSVLESEKPALERRIWYRYPNQPDEVNPDAPYSSGAPSSKATAAARVSSRASCRTRRVVIPR